MSHFAIFPEWSQTRKTKSTRGFLRL